jgi:hypothetical protein
MPIRTGFQSFPGVGGIQEPFAAASSQKFVVTLEEPVPGSLQGKFLTVTDFVGVDIGIHRGTRRPTGFAANSHDTDAG